MTESNNFSVRIDKYLWAIRVYKTRCMATTACNKGKVSRDQKPVKASYSVKPGETFCIKINPHYSRIIEVVEAIDKRGNAETAKKYFKDHSPPYPKLNFEADAFYSPQREKGTGRPTKKERRSLIRDKILL